MCPRFEKKKIKFMIEKLGVSWILEEIAIPEFLHVHQFRNLFSGTQKNNSENFFS